jgi:hypothetical protein
MEMRKEYVPNMSVEKRVESYRYANPLGNIILIWLLGLIFSSVKTLLDVAAYPSQSWVHFSLVVKIGIVIESGRSRMQWLEKVIYEQNEMYYRGLNGPH